MSKEVFTVGLVGYQFMGRAHSNAYRQVNKFFDIPYEVRMKTICGRNAAAVAEAAHRLGWEQSATDWRDLVNDPEIDLIDISTPGESHAEIAIAAAKAGKAVLCEKPLGNDLAQAEAMLKAAEDAKVPNGICHNYRKSPAVTLARQLIDEGRIGRIFHFRAVYLQDWPIDPSFPLIWRLQKDKAGSGTNGDLNAHIIDLARYLVGDFASVTGMYETFIKERPLVDDPTKTGPVTVDDTCAFLARFKNGATGTFEASRFALGRKNHNKFELNGSKGSIIFDLERMNELEFYSADEPLHVQGFHTIQATEKCHPYMGGYWPAAHILGYEHTFTHLIYDALMAIHEGKPLSPSFRDGLENQKVLDAVEKSVDTGSWVQI